MEVDGDEWIGGLRGILVASAAIPELRDRSEELGKRLDTATQLVLHDLLEAVTADMDAVKSLNTVAEEIYALGREFLSAT